MLAHVCPRVGTDNRIEGIKNWELSKYRVLAATLKNMPIAAAAIWTGAKQHLPPKH